MLFYAKHVSPVIILYTITTNKFLLSVIQSWRGSAWHSYNISYSQHAWWWLRVGSRCIAASISCQHDQKCDLTHQWVWYYEGPRLWVSLVLYGNSSVSWWMFYYKWMLFPGLYVGLWCSWQWLSLRLKFINCNSYIIDEMVGKDVCSFVCPLKERERWLWNYTDIDVTQEMWYILFDHSCLFIQVYMFVVDFTAM